MGTDIYKDITSQKKYSPHLNYSFLSLLYSSLLFRTTEFSVELNRFMERFYVESRAIDVESLCIVAGEKVYHIKIESILGY